MIGFMTSGNEKGFAYLTGISSSANSDGNIYFNETVSIAIPEITKYSIKSEQLILTSKVFSGALKSASLSISGNIVTVTAYISNYYQNTTRIAFMISRK